MSSDEGKLKVREERIDEFLFTDHLNPRAYKWFIFCIRFNRYR